MTITLLVLAMLPLHLWLMLNPAQGQKAAEKMMSEENVFFRSGCLFAFALLILSFTGLNFQLKWENTLSILGLLVFLKALAWLFFNNGLKKFAHNIIGSYYSQIIFLAILFDLALIYIDVKLI
ncbi:hypothetical protein HY463_01375 [Candidatus Peregrinibacteria bacterium]|nr:hypothetical protein [Candidatus Peregrinibacteria bacterium]